MTPKNRVFIATSLDGFIADSNGGIEFLDAVPEMNQIDSGYAAFMEKTDALLMGRHTFETVLSFGIDWPYEKMVFVLSTSLTTIPEELKGKVQLVSGTLQQVMEEIHGLGFNSLYIDGGRTIQSFLSEDLIDEMVITVIPILLGSGIPLFGAIPNPLQFTCFESKIFAGQVVQNHFSRKR